MIPKEFSEYFTTCDQTLQQQIIDELLMLTVPNECLPENADLVVLKCPHCESREIRGNGRLKGMQRYVCKACSKNFSHSTGKFWFALKKRDLLTKYLYCLISGFSIRKSATVTGISIQTSFDWRHKFLTSFKSVLPDSFRGIVEQHDLYFQYSEKGIRRPQKLETVRIPDQNLNKNETNIAVIATCDRSGSEDLRVITKGEIITDDIIKSLEGRVGNAEIIVSKNQKCSQELVGAMKLELKKIDGYTRQKKVEAIYHTRNISNLYNRLLTFMSPFHGVATKYLQNYMNWFLMLDKIRHSTQKITTIAQTALSTDRAWFDYKDRNINMYFRT